MASIATAPKDGREITLWANLAPLDRYGLECAPRAGRDYAAVLTVCRA